MNTLRALALTFVSLAATAQAPISAADSESRQKKAAPKADWSTTQNVQSGVGIVGVNPNQPYRPVPVNRAQSRQTVFEFYLRALNPRQIQWGDEIDRQLNALAEQSIGNPYFRLCAIQTAAILLLLLVCWVWWDKMRQIKWVAAECLTDTINAKIIADQRALEAIGRYNRHIEMCNRVVEGQQSGLPGTNSADRWRQELLELQNKLSAETAKSARLEEELRQRDKMQADLEQRLRQLESSVQERQNGANAELVARLQRAEAELTGRKAGKR